MTGDWMMRNLLLNTFLCVLLSSACEPLPDHDDPRDSEDYYEESDVLNGGPDTGLGTRNRCTGTAAECVDRPTSACEGTGCSPGVSCMGALAACTSADTLSTCELLAGDGCEWGYGCLGERQDCTELSSMEVCQSALGCIWSRSAQ